MTLRVNPYSTNLINYQQNTSNNMSFGVGPNMGKTIKSIKLMKQPNILQRGFEIMTEGLARGFGALASLKPVQKITESLHNSKNGIKHLIAGVSVLLTASTIRKIQKSKDIEQEQKLPLTLNQLLTTGVTIAGGYTLDSVLDKGYERFTNTFNKVNAKMVAKEPEVWKNGLKHAKSLMVFGFFYRYLGPVIVTPLANKLSTCITEKQHGNNKQEKKDFVAKKA